MVELATFLGDKESVGAYCSDYETIKDNFNNHAWDGEWFVRYFEANGSPLGSHVNPHGKIYVNGQSWPVISGLADKTRGRTALDSVRRLLNTSNGIKLSAPGFNGYDPTKGGITTYPPGAKENCGIFLHTNPWAIIAETILGNGDAAYQYYDQINPARKTDSIEIYELEPYVYAQNILGDEHQQFGLARNSWLSGTASWVYQAATKHILGIQPGYDGLVIDPCIPSAWDEVTVTRRFRGSIYRIKISNPGHVKKGVASMVVNGQPVEGNVVEIFSDGRDVTVDVKLGDRV